MRPFELPSMQNIIDAYGPTGTTVADNKRRHFKLVWVHDLAQLGTAGSTLTLEPIKKLMRNQVFAVTKRSSIITLPQGGTNTPNHYPLTQTTDPSPPATVGNVTPHVDQVLYQWISQSTDLDPALLPYSLQFGSAREPNENVLDFLLNGDVPLSLTVSNLSTRPVRVFTQLEGILFNESLVTADSLRRQ